MEQNLTNFIKYCLGYIKLTRRGTFAVQQKYSVGLQEEHFNLEGLLNGETDGSLEELINLAVFYAYNPKEVPEEKSERYKQEKQIANKIREIYDKYRNNQFTQQIIINFGYLNIEVSAENETDCIDATSEDDGDELPPQTKFDRYPLFTIPVRIEAEIGKDGAEKYYVYFADPEIQVNTEMLEPILGEDLYYHLVEKIGNYEREGRLTLPIPNLNVFTEIWHNIKALLRLKEVQFDETSFSLKEVRIAISPKANFFLAEDLAKLAQLPEEELGKTSLTSWTRNDELNIENEVPYEKDLYFPFLYDKYQLRALSIINSKAAIIQGPPGTGKSETIANILCHLAATGKKVLFVSQKAQALKVVKDKLKALKIKYLFGYLPNPNSAQLGEEDEADGIAPQLTAIGSYIERLTYELHGVKKTPAIINEENDRGLASAVEEKAGFKNRFTSIIDTQRDCYRLHRELLNLKNYIVTISDFDCFAKKFSFEVWEQIKTTKKNNELLVERIKEYEGTKEKGEFDKIFSNVTFEGKKHANAARKIKDDVSKNGYDRHSNFLRTINNIIRKFRLKCVRDQLPREIIEYIDQTLNRDVSRDQTTKTLASLCNYCNYYENIQQLKESKEHLRNISQNCGFSDGEFEIVDSLILQVASKGANKNKRVDEVKENILRAQRIKTDLHSLKQTQDINETSASIKNADIARSRQIAIYIQNILNQNITEKWKRSVTVKQIVQKLARAFGKSKKAFKTFDNLRKDAENFKAILDLIPIWIMELDDASRIMPLEPGIFDYVILDEASQCNVAYTIPVMFRADHTLFVGDSEQMRDSTILFKSNKSFEELAHRYQIPEELQIKASGSAVQSVLDIASLRGFWTIPLRYHYRSPRELIGFSNRYFYAPKGKELIPLNSNYLTYKDTNRIMLVHEVQSNGESEFSDKINVAEAQAILAFFKTLRNDEKYQDKSIGILSFFNAQAAYIRRLFEEEGFKEDSYNYKVSIIEGIQGDEKDIIIYSFVIRGPEQKNRYFPLTGEGGDIKADINRGRVNVAFSRARLQIHCFVSISLNKIPEKIWLKKYLEYISENGEVDFYSTELKPFDSYFEKEFYNVTLMQLGKGYKIQNQVKSCGFKIDFVINNTINDKRIAIECDGPTHFKDEIDEAYGIYIESDEERQRVLEAAGWKFYRVKYADWIDRKFDRTNVVRDIAQLLE